MRYPNFSFKKTMEYRLDSAVYSIGYGMSVSKNGTYFCFAVAIIDKFNRIILKVMIFCCFVMHKSFEIVVLLHLNILLLNQFGSRRVQTPKINILVSIS